MIWLPAIYTFTECRQMKRAKHQPFARLPHPEASSTITSAPLAPAPLGTILVHLHLNHRLLQGAPSSSTLPPRTVCWLRAGIRGRQTFFSGHYGPQARAHPKAPKGMPPPQLKILLFSPLHHKKVKILPPKGQERQE